MSPVKVSDFLASSMPRIVRTSALPVAPGRLMDIGSINAVPGRPTGALAEAGLVQVERGLAVELVEDVAIRAGDAPGGTEVRPAAVAPEADVQVFAVQARPR